MKYLIVSIQFHPQNFGVGNATTELALALSKKGHEVHVIAPNWNNKFDAKETWNGIITSRISMRQNSLLRHFDYLRIGIYSLYYVLKHKPDIVWGQCVWHGGTISALSKIFFKTMAVTQAHGYDVYELNSLLSRIFTRFALKFNDLVLTTNTEFISMLSKYYKRPMQTLPNILRESPCLESKDFYINKLKLNKNAFNILCVGRLVKVKGVETKGIRYAIDAMKSLEGCELHIFGDGPLKPVYENYAKTHNVFEHTHFYGLVDKSKIYEFLKAADVLLFLSIAEGLPMTIVEAMASSLPVIATKIGGARDYIVDSENGFFCLTDEIDAIQTKWSIKKKHNILNNSVNVSSLVDKIRLLQHNQPLCKKLSKNSYKTYSKYFTPDSVIDRLESILDDHHRTSIGKN